MYVSRVIRVTGYVVIHIVINMFRKDFTSRYNCTYLTSCSYTYVSTLQLRNLFYGSFFTYACT